MRPTLNLTILHSIFITTLDALAGWLAGREAAIVEETYFFKADADYRGSATLFVPCAAWPPASVLEDNLGQELGVAVFRLRGVNVVTLVTSAHWAGVVKGPVSAPRHNRACPAPP